MATDALVDLGSAFNKCYCSNCHGSRQESYTFRDGPGSHNLYTLPVGWSRIMLSLPPRARHLEIFTKWNAAVHGTSPDNVLQIVEGGELLFPGDQTMHGTTLREVEGHFTDASKPAGFNTKQVFLSPSIKYSGCEVYAKTKRVKLPGSCRYVNIRTVLQVRVKPDRFKVGPQTIGKPNPIDPPIGNDVIEWSLTARNCVIPTAVLIQIQEPEDDVTKQLDAMALATQGQQLNPGGKANSGGGVSVDKTVTTASQKMVDHANGLAVSAQAQGKEMGNIAKYIILAFNEDHGKTWHCIMGSSISAYTYSDPGCKIYFTLGTNSILLFRYGMNTEPKPSPRFYPHISPSDRKLIYISKMDKEMEYHVFDCLRRAFEWHETNADRAKFIVNEFDEEHNAGWQCVIGDFASSVYDRHNCYIRLMNYGPNKDSVLLFRY